MREFFDDCKHKEEPWFFPVDYNRWLSNVAL